MKVKIFMNVMNLQINMDIAIFRQKKELMILLRTKKLSTLSIKLI